MRYLQADKEWLLSLDSYEFVRIQDRIKPAEVLVPFYLWDFPESMRHFYVPKVGAEPCVFQNCNQVALNKLTFTFESGMKSVVFAFYDILKKDWSCVRLRSNITLSTYTPSIGQQLTGVEYDIKFDDVAKAVQCKFTRPVKTSVRFHPVDLLDNREVLGMCDDMFSYGVLHIPYRVVYRGRELSGKSYAMLCGYWAVLLDDTMAFDSFVFLNGVSGNVLFIEKFVYTVNSYVVKMRTLLG